MITDVDMVFSDFTDTYSELLASKDSPRKVRKHFTDFVTYSQKLTSIMRKEYKKTTGKKWSAQDFPQWDNISELFSELRNTDQHQIPIRVKIRDSFSFDTDKIFLTSGETGKDIIWEYDWDLVNPSSDEIPQPMTLIIGEPDNPSTVTIDATRRSFSYSLIPSTEEIEDMIKNIGYNDVFLLTEAHYRTIKSYFEYYKGRIVSSDISE